MKEDESIDGYAGNLMSMYVRYANLGGSLDDAALVKKILDTVPERFINVVARIEQFFVLKKIAFDEAVGRLEAFEERTKRSSGSARTSGDQVLLTQA
jgi:protein subunit release factor A